MTISERIRKAALGPTPNDSQWLYGWVGFGTDEHCALKRHSIWCSDGVSTFTNRTATETERRMFLLFVAEALK